MKIKDFIISFHDDKSFKSTIEEKISVLADELKEKRVYKDYEFKEEIMQKIYKQNISENIVPSEVIVKIRKVQ